MKRAAVSVLSVLLLLLIAQVVFNVMCWEGGICAPQYILGYWNSIKITSSPVRPEELVVGRAPERHCRGLTGSVPGDKKIVVVLSTQKSGSSWFVWRLGTHPNIFSKSEVLHHPHKDCLLTGREGCDWCDMEQKLNDALTNAAEEASRYLNVTTIAFKVMYDQIRSELPQFAAWCARNKVTVLHFYRGASISSYWTWQAQVVDRIQTGSKSIRIQAQGSEEENKQQAFATNNELLDIDHKSARNYVKNLEDLRLLVTRTLRYYPDPILLHEVVYEQLMGELGEEYWRLVFTLLHLDPDLETEDTIVRVHPVPCHQKIKNWPVFRKTIEHTDSYYACNLDI